MLSKINLKSIIRTLWKLFSPIGFLKYTLNEIKRNKWLFVVVAIFSTITVFAKGMDLSWLNPQENMVFIGATEHLSVSLTDSLGTRVQTIYNLIMPVGQALAVLYWLMQFGEVMMRSDLTPEHIALQFLKIAAFVTAIGYGWQILSLLFDFFNAVYSEVVASLGTIMSSTLVTVIPHPGPGGYIYYDYVVTTITLPITFDGLKEVDWWIGIPIFLELGAFQLVRVACMVATSLIVWTRKLKLLAYASMAPVGVADFIGGTKSASMRYFKKLLALGLQGMIMYIVAYLGNVLIYDNLNTWIATSGLTGDYVDLITTGNLFTFTFLIAATPCALAMLAAFNKSEEIANGVIGAH